MQCPGCWTAQRPVPGPRIVRRSEGSPLRRVSAVDDTACHREEEGRLLIRESMDQRSEAAKCFLKGKKAQSSRCWRHGAPWSIAKRTRGGGEPKKNQEGPFGRVQSKGRRPSAPVVTSRSRGQQTAKRKSVAGRALGGKKKGAAVRRGVTHRSRVVATKRGCHDPLPKKK